MAKPASSFRFRAAGVLLAGFALCLTPAFAVEYRSVAEPAILYDAPSQKGGRLFVIKRLTPVELVVNLDGWAKVRDASGGLAWIERRLLSERRTLQVVADRAQIRRAAEDGAPVVFEAERGVALELLEPGPTGWVQVRHADGVAGFLRVTQVWGL